MISRRVSRSVRRLAGGLAVLALLAAVGAPAQADSGSWSAPAAPMTQVLDWIQDALARLGFVIHQPAPEEPAEPQRIFGREGCGVDPNGVPCAEIDSVPPGQSPEQSIPSDG